MLIKTTDYNDFRLVLSIAFRDGRRDSGWPGPMAGFLVLCNTHSDGYSLVAAAHLRRQRYSPRQEAGFRSLPCI